MLNEYRGKDEAVDYAAKLYAEIAGAHVGNIVLQNLPAGGIWICGGVAQKMQKLLCTEDFKRAFFNKSPMEHLLHQSSVALVTHPDVGLLGSTSVAYALLQENRQWQ